MYEFAVKHDALHKFRVIRGRDRYVVEQKARAQMRQWDEMWARRSAANQRAALLAQRAGERQIRKHLAKKHTADAEATVKELSEILAATLSVNDTIDWESLKDNTKFEIPRPTDPPALKLTAEPDPHGAHYRPQIGMLDRIFSWRQSQKESTARVRFSADHSEWQAMCERKRKAWSEADQQHSRALLEWQEQAQAFAREQAVRNGPIDALRARYQQADSGAIEEYCDLVLSRSQYPDYFPQEYQLEYLAPTKTLVVEYSLPAVNQISRIEKVRFIQARNESVEIQMNEKKFGRLYDNLLYQIVLRTIHELFEADAVKAIDCIVLNGWVRSIDVAMGNDVNACILSLQVQKSEFLAANLAHVDPKSLFPQTKGSWKFATPQSYAGCTSPFTQLRGQAVCYRI
jgi:restriction system protein